MNNLDISLNNLRDAKEPAIRKCYLDSIKHLVEIGEELNRLNPSEETKKGIENLKKIVEDYRI